LLAGPARGRDIRDRLCLPGLAGRNGLLELLPVLLDLLGLLLGFGVFAGAGIVAPAAAHLRGRAARARGELADGNHRGERQGEHGNDRDERLGDRAWRGGKHASDPPSPTRRTARETSLCTRRARVLRRGAARCPSAPGGGTP